MNTPLISKSVGDRLKKAIPPANPLLSTIQVWPAAPVGYGVAIKLDGKNIKSRLCRDKQAIIAFLTDEL